MNWSIVYTKQAQKDAKKIASSNLKSQAQRPPDIILDEGIAFFKPWFSHKFQELL